MLIIPQYSCNVVFMDAKLQVIYNIKVNAVNGELMPPKGQLNIPTNGHSSHGRIKDIHSCHDS